MIAKVCADNNIPVTTESLDFPDIAIDILFNRSHLSMSESTNIFLELLDKFSVEELEILNNRVTGDNVFLTDNSQFTSQQSADEAN
ncbi:MAG: gas vesicle protein GvpN, partial [Aphanizomenon sp.]